MRPYERINESFGHVIKRTIITTTAISVILLFFKLFPDNSISKLAHFGVLWLTAFCIVFGGHWLELLFINSLKWFLPRKLVVLWISRILYWYLSAIPLFFLASFTIHILSGKNDKIGEWWLFGLFYTIIELLMYTIMHLRLKKSFYNGVF